jgi:hypothetical protein
MSWIRAHRAVAAGIGVALAAVVAVVAFGFFGVHTLLVDDVVDEEGPVFDSGAVAAASEEDPTSTAPPSSGPAPASPTTTAPAPTIATTAEGTFVARSHPAEGRAVVLSDGAQRFLRFEDFATDNGPDLFVYLSRGVDADGAEAAFDDDFVDLGRLKGNVGEQNYEVPADVDLAEFDTVVIWCRRFATAFGAADLR